MRLSRQLRRIIQVAPIAVCIAIFANLTIAVRGNGDHEPIFLTVEAGAVAGDPLLCDVQLDGGPAHITITSDPPGAVSFSGTLASGHEVVTAQTSPNAPSGPVVVTVQTDGAQTVSDVTYLY